MERVYIAHPLYGDGSDEWGHPELNVERALKFMAMATNEGHTVISWAYLYFTHLRRWTQGDTKFYLERDAKLIEVCDKLWVCGPPEISSGTRFEIALAEKLGITIVQKPEWMLRDFDPFPQ